MRRPSPKKSPGKKSRAAPPPPPPPPPVVEADDQENADADANNDESSRGLKNIFLSTELPPPREKVDDLPFPSQARCGVPGHGFEPLLWYCATCRLPLCNLCRVEAHGAGHETVSFDEITAPTLRRLAQLGREVDERQSALAQIDVPRLVERLCQTVDSEMAYLDARLARRCDEIKQDVRDRAARMRQEIEDEVRVCEDYLQKVQDTMDVLQCINVGEEPSQHPLFVPLMNGHISCSHFLRAAAPVDRYTAPRIVDNLRLLELPSSSVLEACRHYNWTELSLSSVPELYPRGQKL